MASAKNEWIQYPDTKSIVPLNGRQLGRLARRGEISVRKLPASRPAYLRAELEQLAANSVRPSRHALAAAAR